MCVCGCCRWSHDIGQRWQRETEKIRRVGSSVRRPEILSHQGGRGGGERGGGGGGGRKERRKMRRGWDEEKEVGTGGTVRRRKRSMEEN